MKAANPTPPSGNSSVRRAQPVRQTRVNPPRVSGSVPRAAPGARSTQAGQDGGSGPIYPPAFFPAITHFTDCIAALPKEVIRQFTLLKEVDAKACGPEETLAQLTDLALRTSIPRHKQAAAAIENTGGSADTSTTGVGVSAPAENASSSHNGHGEGHGGDGRAHAVDGASDTTRRHIFLNLRYVVSEMLMTLDDKNRAYSTANEALEKQDLRMSGSYPYIDNEVSEEARLGSLRHWAYNDKSGGKANGASGPTDRARRDLVAANSLAAAAAAMNEETATRENRREALQSKRSRKQQHADSDFDEDHRGRHRDGLSTPAHQPAKKSHAKVRKPVDAGATGPGLGITSGQSVVGNPPSKRRKTEKATNGDSAGNAAMERSMSSALGNHVTGGKGKAGSPRETPAAEGGRKRARGGGGSGGNAAAAATVVRKRNNTTTAQMQSPSLASSPVQATFAASKDTQYSSPAPNQTQRPQSSRARKNSSQSLSQEQAANNARQRSFSSTSNKPQGTNGASSGAAELANVAGLTGRSVPEVKSSMREAVNSKGEHLLEDKERNQEHDLKGALVVGIATNGGKGRDNGAEGKTAKRDDTTAMGTMVDHEQSSHGIRNTTITTNARKASKTSTPVTATFSDPHKSRPRPSRAQAAASHDSTGSTKRSHKKGAGAAAAAQQQHQQLTQTVGHAAGGPDDEGSSMQGDDEEDEDTSGQRYCYCNQVSYGEMVACDADGCRVEWFHLGCVGLAKAPTKNAKWYCDECKESLKKSKFNSSGGR